MEKVLKGKRILIHTNHFYPETFRVNDVAFSLASEGHEVTVITGIPDYPQGTFYKGYGLFRRSREVVNGVKVVRVPLVPRGKGGSMRLALNYLTYLLSATCFSLWYALTRKYDCIFVHETSPVTVGIPAVLVKKIQRIPLYFWVLDLWPESLEAAGGIHNRTILGLFDAAGCTGTRIKSSSVHGDSALLSVRRGISHPESFISPTGVKRASHPE